MKTNDVRELLNSHKLDEEFLELYSKDTVCEQYGRYLEVLDAFCELFSKERDVSLFSAPGRSEVGGNHTDHNHGKVLACGIDLDAIAVCSKNETGIINIKSKGYNMDSVDTTDLEKKPVEEGKSISMIRGIAARFLQLGYNVGGFDATTASKVLSGSGLSSSAAFEVLCCTMLNHLYNDGKISPIEIAKISQYAENVYFGKPSGLLDQMSCSVAGFVTVDFEDPENPIVKKLDFDIAKSGYSLCIVDTKGSHSDLTDEYAAVRSEMEAVAGAFGKSVLREITKEDVIKNAAELSKNLGQRAVLRALHFFGENERVDSEVGALLNEDFEKFLSIIIESGHSSFMYNQNVFSSKDAKNQPLSLALALSEDVLKGRGAWRVHGGGFAGTIQAFVPADLLDTYLSVMKSVFGDDSCYTLKVRPKGGVCLV